MSIRALPALSLSSFTLAPRAWLGAAALVLAACAADPSDGARGQSRESGPTLMATASAETRAETGIEHWRIVEQAGERSAVYGLGSAGEVVTEVDTEVHDDRGLLRVNGEELALGPDAEVGVDTLSEASRELIQRASADLGLALDEPGRLRGEKAKTLVTTTTANCVACWLMTMGTGAEFCYKFGHCDN